MVITSKLKINSLQRYGGNSIVVNIYRSWFEVRSALVSMWKGNPVLTLVLFGLPAGFLSLICYNIWCPDIFDADEEDEGILKHFAILCVSR